MQFDELGNCAGFAADVRHLPTVPSSSRPPDTLVGLPFEAASLSERLLLASTVQRGWVVLAPVAWVRQTEDDAVLKGRFLGLLLLSPGFVQRMPTRGPFLTMVRVAPHERSKGVDRGLGRGSAVTCIAAGHPVSVRSDTLGGANGASVAAANAAT